MNTPEFQLLSNTGQEQPRTQNSYETTSQIEELNRNLRQLNTSIREFQNFIAELHEKTAPGKKNKTETSPPPASKTKKRMKAVNFDNPRVKNEMVKETVKKLLREIGEPFAEDEDEEQLFKRAMEKATLADLTNAKPKFPTLFEVKNPTPAPEAQAILPT